MSDPNVMIKWECDNDRINSFTSSDNVWYGMQADPVFVDDHEGYWELYDYEDYYGIMQQLLAEEWGYEVL